MSVVSICQGYTGVSASARSFTDVFTLACDSPTDGPLFAWPVTVGGKTIPKAGTVHGTHTTFKAEAPEVTKKGPGYFEVKVVWSIPGNGGEYTQPDEYIDDPLSEPAEISWESEVSQVPYNMDLDGFLVANYPFLIPFDPPPTREISDPVLVIERSEAAFDPDVKLEYENTVCSEIFRGAAIGRAKLGVIQSRLVNAATPYARTRYQVKFRMQTPTGIPDAKAWWRVVANTSPCYTGAGGILHSFPDGQVRTIRMINAAPAVAGDTDIWLYFRECFDKSWAALGINAS